MASNPEPSVERQRIAITGSSGLLGSRLVARLKDAGHEVARVVRREARAGANEISWQPDAGKIDKGGCEGLDAVVHLAGKSIMGRWTKSHKREIEESRVQPTRLLSETIAGLENPPRVLLSASALGYYGDRGDEPLDEESGPGRGFLAEVCQRWEAATKPAEDAGIRVVHLRIGVVLAKEGGALGQMLTPFRMGAGGPIGDGKQYMSWISATDLIEIMCHLLLHSELSGPVNAVSPSPVTNHDFAKTLGRVLHRPTVARVPATVLKFMFGEMADEMLLASARLQPSRLQADGYTFAYPDLEAALRHELDREDD